MKKAFALLLVLALALSLMAGCGDSKGSAVSAAPGESAASVPAESEAPTVAPEEETPAAGSAVENSVMEEPVEKGPFVANPASLPLADGATLTYFCELPGYMSMFNVNDYDDLEPMKYAEEITGVDIDFTIVNMESLQTNFQLMIASGDITDMVSGVSDQYASSAQMIEDGVAIDLMEYQDSLPNFWKVLEYYDAYKPKAITQDGTMPEIICIADDYMTQSGMQIRKDWLDKLGMDVPETIDQLHEALLGFVSECGADKALLLTGSPQMTGTSIVGGMGTIGYDPSISANMYVVDGEIRNGFLDEKYKEYMQMVAQWYEEGIIAKDFATESNDPFTSNADSYIQGGNAGVWSSMSDNMDQNLSAGKSLDPEYDIVPMAQPMENAGDKFHFGDSEIGANAMGKNITISDCCEDVELACSWIDFFFSEEGIRLANYGLVDNDSWDASDDTYSDIAEDMNMERLTDGTFPMISFGTTYYTLACVATLQDFDRVFGTYSELNLSAMELWTETADDLYTLPAAMELSIEENEEYSGIWSDLSTYANTEIFKFVMGEYNFEEDWDNFIDQLKEMGIEDCVEIYQTAYDRYVEAYGE